MSTSAMQSQGVKLQRGDGATSEAFATVAEVLGLKGPTETRKTIDVTSLDSTVREFLPGLKDGGEISFDLNLIGNNTGHQGLHTDFAAGTKRNFKLLLTDDATTPSTAAFVAIVTEYGVDASVDSQIKASIKLKLTSAPTWTWKT